MFPATAAALKAPFTGSLGYVSACLSACFFTADNLPTSKLRTAWFRSSMRAWNRNGRVEEDFAEFVASAATLREMCGLYSGRREEAEISLCVAISFRAVSVRLV